MTPGQRLSIDAAETVQRLALIAHPEGGWYREIFRSEQRVRRADGAERSASTAILYLLDAGGRSAWHQVAADEVWHHYAGGALRIYRLGMESIRLSRSDPVGVVPAGVWQAAEPEDGAVLVGCTVAPGFEFSDFVLGQASALTSEFPADAELIARLSTSP